eukprot:3420211-Amphidinium_carterae.1
MLLEVATLDGDLKARWWVCRVPTHQTECRAVLSSVVEAGTLGHCSYQWGRPQESVATAASIRTIALSELVLRVTQSCIHKQTPDLQSGNLVLPAQTALEGSSAVLTPGEGWTLI